MYKIRVGITGQAGFIGSHLFNYLGINKDKYERIWFEDEYFYNENNLNNFLSNCDAIVHLAALNRHSKPDEIYTKNIELVNKLITGLEKTKAKPHIIFSSSTQETLDNIYGQSKKEGREILKKWCKNSGAGFTGLLIPNVFGPFGKPFYNSVISTFSYQITHNQTPRIEIDKNLELIYVNNLVGVITEIIGNNVFSDLYKVNYDFDSKVKEILEKLNNYNENYLKQNIIPKLKSRNEINLFNTFRSYIEYDQINRMLDKKEDNRGYLTELSKSYTEGQTFISETHPGITRGNHYHLRKIERFAVIKGEALIRLRRIGSNDIKEYKVSGEKPSFIDIPIWHTHNIENTGDSKLLTLFWSNELFNPEDSDTYFEEV